jgi:hypothetical protein
MAPRGIIEYSNNCLFRRMPRSVQAGSTPAALKSPTGGLSPVSGRTETLGYVFPGDGNGQFSKTGIAESKTPRKRLSAAENGIAAERCAIMKFQAEQMMRSALG